LIVRRILRRSGIPHIQAVGVHPSCARNFVGRMKTALQVLINPVTLTKIPGL
jgi:hypothetical protein